MKRKSVFDFAVEFVTDIVMGSDGSVDAKGLDDRDMSPAAGWHFGFYSRPLDGAVGVVLRFFGMQFLIAYRDKQYELSLQKGEVGLQNAFNASVLLDKNGNVIFNAGTLKVARVTDPLAVGTLTGIAGPYPVTFTYVPMTNVGGADTPGAPSTGPSVNLAGIISNSGGNPKVKG